MSEKLRTHLLHALLSLLLSVGLLLPLLGILLPDRLSPALLPGILLIILLFEAASLNRITALVSSGMAVFLLLLWLFGLGGMLTLSDTVLALGLCIGGVQAALPLAASSAVLLLTGVVTLLSCFVCLRGASVLPASLLCFGMILAIYLTGSEQVIVWFLPALTGLLLLYVTDRFPETSLAALLPLTALLVAAAFLLAGNGVGDNSLQQKADEIRQAVLDRLFFTEPRDVFSLSAEGYYPQGQDQLGGKPDPDPNPVMQVTASRSVYLRGVILNEYTGRGWRNTTGGRRYLRDASRPDALRAALFDEDLPPQNIRNALCDPVRVDVRMLSGSASTLFVPQRVRDLVPGGDLVPYYSNSSELFITRNLQEGDTYSVSAPLFRAGDPGLSTLIEVCSTLEDDQYSRIEQLYTALPGHLESQIFDLAREAASVAASPYDRALALQTWLGRSFRYTLDVEPQPADLDFVTTFLLDTREGYCTYFASAMTVLCRAIGLPARYIEGYLAEPDAGGVAVVTGLSAHAWTEVYFKGFGWLTFDPTPRSSGGGSGTAPSPSAEQPSPTPSPEPPEDPGAVEPSATPSPDPEKQEPSPEPDEPDSTPEGTPDSSDNAEDPTRDPGVPANPAPENRGSFPWLWLLLLLPAALILRIVLTSPSFRARRAATEEARFDIWCQELTDLLYAENLVRRAGESPIAFGRRVDRTGLFTESFGPVGECISLIRYSRTLPNETDTGLLRDTSVLTKAELSRPARLRYLLRRVFLPRSRHTG